jgi:hypothetical protein
MLARLTTKPLYRSLELHRPWTRAFHDLNLNPFFAGSKNRYVDFPTKTAFDSNKTKTRQQNHLGSVENLDVMLEGIFQRAFPVPHTDTAILVGGRPLVCILNVPPEAVYDPSSSAAEEGVQLMNRNARRPNKANKGARPCSRASRRKKKEKIGKRGR